MKVNPVTPAQPVQLKKQLTVHGCCDNINISSGTTIVMFGTHRYLVKVDYCKSCGSKKATSSITHVK